MTTEQDLRLKLFNTLLTTPHRDLDGIYQVHQEILKADPRFYVQLAAWYFVEGEVRDHKEVFVACLALSDFPGHRDVGLALMRQLPPYEVGRVVDFVKGGTVRRRVRRGPAVESVTEKQGLFGNVPRSMRTEVTRYLREREADPDWFDSSALQARQALKRLYAGLHIAPSARAQAILFDDNPPPDSRLLALKQIARAKTPAEQARAIVEHRIPYRVAASVIKQMTPTVLVALVEAMSPQELINSLGSLRARGALDSPEVKALVEAKLEKARASDRVSAFKAKVAIEASGVGKDVAQKLQAVTQAQVEAKGTIRRSTALLIDKSGSMTQAIEMGKQIAAMVAGVCEAPLFVYAFDSLAYPIGLDRRNAAIAGVLAYLWRRLGTEPQPGQAQARPTLADWEKAFAGISAGGQTSCGVAVEMMRRQGQAVEQIVMVTDEGENTAPYFVEALARYRQELKVDPHVVFVKTRGAINLLEERCRQARVDYDVYQFTGDYYALPGLLPLLSRPSRLDLLLEIMAYPLPVRKAA